MRRDSITIALIIFLAGLLVYAAILGTRPFVKPHNWDGTQIGSIAGGFAVAALVNRKKPKE